MYEEERRREDGIIRGRMEMERGEICMKGLIWGGNEPQSQFL
jgi:hypothetical protein